MKNYRYILSYNDLIYSEVLGINPIGWNELGITYTRNEFYKSILRNFTLSLRFVKKPGGGGEKIEEAYRLTGISADVDIEIQELNPNTNDYDTIYLGVLDFNADRFAINRDWIEAGVIDSGKLQRFKSRDEINFDVKSLVSADNVTVPDFTYAPKDIIFKKIDLYRRLYSTGKNSKSVINQTGSSESKTSYYSNNITINEIGDGMLIIGAPSSVDFTIYRNEFEEETTRINISTVSITENISYIIRSGQVRSTATLFFRVYNNLDVLQSTYSIVLYTDELITADKTFSDTVTENDIELTIPEDGGYLDFYCLIDTFPISAPPHDYDVINSSDYTFNFSEITTGEPNSAVESFFVYELITRLIQLITSETDTAKLFYSEFFGRTNSEFQTYPSMGPGAYDVVTSGWNIRDFTDKSFNINIRDLFEGFTNIYSLGLGYDRVNDRFYIEPLDQFYDASYLMFDLGDVDELVIKPHRESFDSKLETGYVEKGDYEEFQGVNEFNLQSEHSTVLPVKQTKNLRTKLNTDSVGIELARRKPARTDASEDTKQDEKIFIVRTDGNYTVQGGTDLSGFEGIEQYYNIVFTPRENIIRQSGLMKSSLWLHTLRIKYVKSQKDIDITYRNQNSDIVNESDDLVTADLTDVQLYVPETYEFESKINGEILSILNDNPHGYIRFNFDGITYEGYLLNVESGYYNRKATYKLIAKELTEGDNYVFENEYNSVFENSNNYVFD